MVRRDREQKEAHEAERARLSSQLEHQGMCFERLSAAYGDLRTIFDLREAERTNLISQLEQEALSGRRLQTDLSMLWGNYQQQMQELQAANIGWQENYERCQYLESYCAGQQQQVIAVRQELQLQQQLNLQLQGCVQHLLDSAASKQQHVSSAIGLVSVASDCVTSHAA